MTTDGSTIAMFRTPRPALPEPALARWQPLRMGLVDLFHYDSEEFWFRDGHLLLRGNNGTGKSKVLSLTLPFLLDAQIKPSRLEPDGDAGKRMSWNLLLGRYERRVGYAWLELGQRTESGEPRYLTLGAGLSAVAGRSETDCWFFVLDDRRIGADLWLTTPQRVVLTRERLREALGEHGQVFDTAASYRRIVDERLFRLGTVRYAALMDTLVQLRQPQLSRKPDEASLSQALTEALPPISTELLSDVAEALGQLEEDRRQLEEHEALAQAVGRFNTRYRLYAQVQSRRRARGLRSAQTAYDNASRAHNEATAGLEAARLAEAQAQAAFQAADEALRACRARLETLRADPAMQDANRLALAEKEAADRRRDAREAETFAAELGRRLAREVETTAHRRAAYLEATRALAAARDAASRTARDAGLAPAVADSPLLAAPADALAAAEAASVEQAREALRRGAADRGRQIILVRQHRETLDRREHERMLAARARDERRDDRDDAAARREAADRAVETCGSAVVEAWQAHLAQLSVLAVADPGPMLAELALWVVGLDGDNPARKALHAAQQAASERLASRHAAAMADRDALIAERAALGAEQAELEQGRQLAPPPPANRAPGTRDARAGAPFWQTVEFRAGIGEAERAGLEAALEASGVLDAWVAPEGRLAADDGTDLLHDTMLRARPPADDALARWLEPAGSLVPAETVQRLLESMRCAPADDDCHETWFSPGGRFRIGTLSGAWSKPAAAFIGHAAREAARSRRLGTIAARQAEIAEALGRVEAQLALIARDRGRAATEWQHAPTDDALRRAHAEASGCARAFGLAVERLAQAEQQCEAADAACAASRETLQRDADDLRLPTTADGLRRVEQHLAAFAASVAELVQAARALRTSGEEQRRQIGREQEIRNDAGEAAAGVRRRATEAEEAAVRWQTLRQAVGARVEQLEAQLAQARDAAGMAETEREARDDGRRLAAEQRARAEERSASTAAILEERGDLRGQSVAQFQAFAATGLLQAALPDAELPEAGVPWTIDPALSLARRTEQALVAVADSDEAWTRVQGQLSQDYTELGRSLTGLGHQTRGDTTDFGLVVVIVYRNQPERPDRLTALLDDEIAQRRELLSAREREVLENHLQAEIAATIQKLLQDAERQVEAVNRELGKRPTSTGVKFRLQWQPLPEGADGAPVGLEAARRRLLNTSADLWSPEDRRVVGTMLQQRIEIERANAEIAGSGGSLLDQLARALDYRRWHRFAVQRWQDGEWRRLSGPASSGERALGLTVPLFAAVASFYSQSSYPHAPRLVLLDEAFAGIDDAARAHCMGLIREFDLDFAITSEREWGCYAELPGVSICQLQRREGIDAVHVSRWTWDGRARQRQEDPNRRFPPDERAA